MQTQQVERVTNLAGLAFGVLGTVAPQALLRSYGATDDDAVLGHMTRLWGTRTIAICTLGLLADDSASRRRLASVAVAMNAVDTVVGIAGGSGVPAKLRWQGALTSGAFAAIGAWVLSRRDV